ncbi:hypothetical protein Rhe02_41490 [Rhizocola hellebori]|uniref:ABM domain-containing protein n=1 Tax=Rhizocola hellebori TaxID=1392758 RepID=A0A8J3QAA6_9ACTN|nr:antibiotic biosynthesis monooxygenase [Rhizocola hellebori]GIH06082.1 hypothetical protein Rhe02_41490 [Rhizocola hellebori]
MSVIMMLRVKGDPAALESYASNHGETLKKIASEGKAKGCIHHHFAAADGEVLVIDEWPSEEAFRDFFDNQAEIPEVMAKVGAKGKPEVMVYRKLETPDSF